MEPLSLIIRHHHHPKMSAQNVFMWFHVAASLADLANLWVSVSMTFGDLDRSGRSESQDHLPKEAHGQSNLWHWNASHDGIFLGLPVLQLWRPVEAQKLLAVVRCAANSTSSTGKRRCPFRHASCPLREWLDWHPNGRLQVCGGKPFHMLGMPHGKIYLSSTS